MSERVSYSGMMRAVFPGEAEGRFVVRDVRIPEPGPGEVLVRMRAAPVNPSDLGQIRMMAGDPRKDTFIPGLEGSGKVVATGSGLLPKLWLGRRVACSAGHHGSGTWAEFMVAKATGCFPLSRHVSDEQGSMTLVNPLTALDFLDFAREHRQKAIIINPGASALGMMIEYLCNKENIRVINIVRNAGQAARLKQSGRAYVVDSSAPTFIADLGRLTGEHGASMFFDSVCSRQTAEICDILPYGSRIVIYGNISGEERIEFTPRTLVFNNIRITGYYLGNSAKENGLLRNLRNLRRVSALMSHGMNIHVRARFGLESVEEAIKTYTSNMSAGKVLLVMDPDQNGLAESKGHGA